LAESRVGVLRLVNPGIEAHAEKRHRIERALDKQKELVF